MDLVAVGDVMLDVRAEAGALARGGDVHGRVVVQPGGSAANAAVWAAWTGATVALYGRTGDDVGGRILREALAERGVDPHLSIDAEAPTGTMLVVMETGERSMVADRGANAKLRPEDLPAALVGGAVLVSGYLLLQEDSRPTALAALLRAEGDYVAVDPASWPLIEAFGVERFFEETARANVIVANALEARTLTGQDDEAAAAALGRRFDIAAVKLGRRGAIVCVEGEILGEPGRSVVEIDPTGAGDAFDGVFLASLVAGRDPAESLRRACHAGALQVSSSRGWPEGSAS